MKKVTVKEILPNPKNVSAFEHMKKIPAMGLLLAVASGMLFTTETLLVKLLKNSRFLEVLMFRCLITVFVYIPVIAFKRPTGYVVTGERLYFIVRCITGFISVATTYASYRLMPLGDAASINLSSPIFVGIFACIFLKEPCGITSVISTAITIFGVVLICRPPYLFDTTTTDNEIYQIEGTLLALNGAIFGAITLILVRKLQKSSAPAVICFYSLFVVIVTASYLTLFHELRIPDTTEEQVLLAASGLVGTLGQLSFSLALKLEEASPVSIARTLSIVVAFIYQVTFFHEEPHWTSYVGSCMITATVVFSGVLKYYKQAHEHKVWHNNFFHHLLKDLRACLESYICVRLKKMVEEIVVPYFMTGLHPNMHGKYCVSEAERLAMAKRKSLIPIKDDLAAIF